MPADHAATGIVWRHGAALPAARARTLPELIAAALTAHGSHPVLIDQGRSWSWEQLTAAADGIAGAWSATLPPGGRVALLAGNSVEHLLVELAAWRLGAVAAPLPPNLPDARVREILTAYQPQLAYLEDLRRAGVVPAGCRLTGPGQLWQAAAHPPALQRAVEPGSPCLIQLTSGSSGAPRGVVLSHDNLASQQSAYGLLWPEVGRGDRLAGYLPWHHSFGGQAERLWALLRGVTVTVVPGGGRDRARFCSTLREVAPTLFMSVPKMHGVALQEGLFRPGQLRWAFTAGAPLPAALWQAYERLGIRVHEGWGLTETSPSATITPPAESRTPGVVGRPIPGVAVGVESSSGRILIRGPNVMLGYVGGEAPPLVALADGGVALDSGDLGAWCPEGLRLQGRADCMLKLGNGEKVWVPGIEARLAVPPVLHAVVLAAEGVLVAVVDAAAGASDAAVRDALVTANAGIEPSCNHIARCYRLQEPMALENGLLTASLKVARGAVIDRWQAWTRSPGSSFTEIALPGPGSC